MSEKFIPRPYQEIMVNHILKHDRCAIWAGMGMGKTPACLHAIVHQRLYCSDKILVIAPLRVARDVWPNEVEKWDEFKHLTYATIIGTEKERIQAVRKNTDIHIVNYENIVWLLDAVGVQWPWTMIILDESTRMKSFRLRQGGKRARALGKMTWTKIKKVIELTGTPNPNGFLDLWGQLWFLDRGERLELSYTNYVKKYFKLKHPNSFQYILNTPETADVISNKVKDICISLKFEDWYDIDKPIHYKISVYMDAALQKIYDKFQKDLVLKLQSGDNITANFAASLSIKSLQFANGAMYIDDQKNWKEVHRYKLEALENIINELSGENIIVAYFFKSDLIRLKKYFPKGQELDQKSATIKKWNEGKIPLLFLHPASAGHGLNLQHGGRTIVFFSHWWNLEQREQAIERVGVVRQFQAGYNRAVLVYDICTVDTIDELVLQRHKTKQSIQEILLNLTNTKELKNEL